MLLVEDDVLIRDSSAELLTSHGYVVAQASSAEAAMILLGRDRFDVLVTDTRVDPEAVDFLTSHDIAVRRA